MGSSVVLKSKRVLMLESGRLQDESMSPGRWPADSEPVEDGNIPKYIFTFHVPNDP